MTNSLVILSTSTEGLPFEIWQDNCTPRSNADADDHLPTSPWTLGSIPASGASVPPSTHVQPVLSAPTWRAHNSSSSYWMRGLAGGVRTQAWRRRWPWEAQQPDCLERLGHERALVLGLSLQSHFFLWRTFEERRSYTKVEKKR